MTRTNLCNAELLRAGEADLDLRKEEIPETQEVRRDEALGENVAAVVGGVNLNETNGVIGDFLCDKHVMDFDVLDPGLFGGVIA